MSKFLPFLLSILCFATLHTNTKAQVSFGGEPYNWDDKSQLSVNSALMPSIDLDALIAEDLVTDQHKDIPPRFAFPHEVNINLMNQSPIEQINGVNIYRFAVEAPEAISIGITFGEFYLPEGAKMFMYDIGKTGFIGSFTNANNKPWGSLGVQPVFTNNLVIEYHIPINKLEQTELVIETVAQGYRWIGKTESRDFGSSGSCNNNVICPVSIGWSNQIKSVGLIATANGTRLCTGTLINNANNNGTPYFLTANHCLGTGTPNWVIIFNYESTVCSHPGTNGSLSQSISGTSVQVNSPGSTGTDMALLLLAETPPASYNLFYSGWNKSATPSTASVGIHHPAGDVKKISFDEDPVQASAYLNTAPTPPAGGRYWRVNNWEDGTTEGGSSGSALFDSNGYIIGQLYGGFASCNSITQDYYGRFDLSWPLLQPFLDPNNIVTGNTLEGLIPEQPDYNISLSSLNGVSNQYCSDEFSLVPSITILNFGSEEVSFFDYEVFINDVSVQSETFFGSLVGTSGSTTLTLSAIDETDLIIGENILRVEISNPNGVEELPQFTLDNEISTSFLYNPTGSGIIFELQRDFWGAETTWRFENESGDVLLSGGPYTNTNSSAGLPPLLTFDLCITEGCYEFIINDTANDGICCGFGQGSYEIINASTNAIIASGGDFNGQEVVPFCLESVVSVSENDVLEKNINIYPNPANSVINIEWKNNTLPNEINILDITGKSVINKRNLNTELLQIDVQSLSIGTYFVEVITTDNTRIVQKLIISK